MAVALYLMGRPGFEPGTNRLKAEYSTVELATLVHCGASNVYHPNMNSTPYKIYSAGRIT